MILIASFLSFMVLNWMMLKIFLFNPGMAWKKKGLPWLAKYKPIVTIIKIGLNNNNPKNAAMKSIRLFRYVFRNLGLGIGS